MGDSLAGMLGCDIALPKEPSEDMKLILLICSLFVLAGCTGLKPHRLTTQDVYERRALVDAPFHLGQWRLLLGMEMNGIVGDPIEAFTHMYAERDGCFMRIDRPADFERLSGICIRTPDEALALVRIFTDNQTYLYFSRPRAVEYPEGNATVRSVPDGYFVSRNLLYLKRAHRGFHVRQVQEFVSPNGAYSRRRGSLIAILPRLPEEIPIFQ
jgi:hypothetical protein